MHKTINTTVEIIEPLNRFGIPASEFYRLQEMFQIKKTTMGDIKEAGLSLVHDSIEGWSVLDGYDLLDYKIKLVADFDSDESELEYALDVEMKVIGSK